MWDMLGFPPEYLVFSVLVVLMGGTQLWASSRLRRRLEARTTSELKRQQQSWQQTMTGLNRQIQLLESAQKNSMSEMRRVLGRMELRGLSSALSRQPAGFSLDKKHHVLTLAQKGMRTEEIADRLKMYQGETELVLGLKEYAASRGNGHERDSM